MIALVAVFELTAFVLKVVSLCSDSENVYERRHRDIMKGLLINRLNKLSGIKLLTLFICGLLAQKRKSSGKTFWSCFLNHSTQKPVDPPAPAQKASGLLMYIDHFEEFDFMFIVTEFCETDLHEAFKIEWPWM